MRNLFTFVLCASLTLGALAQENPITKGLTYYKKRAEGATGLHVKPDNINQAIAYFKIALEQSETEERAVALLIRSYDFKGTFVETDKKKKKEVYNLGKELGLQMMEKYPKSATIHYWHVSNLAKLGETEGIMKGAREGLADRLKELAETVISLNPEYRNGAGYRTLGIVHFRAPYIPFILPWPDNDDAIDNLQKCLALNPDDLLANLYLGQVYYDEGDEDKAIEIMEKVAMTEPSKANFLEDSKDIKEAKELLVKYRK